MLTKAKATKDNAIKPAKSPTAGGAGTDGKRPPVVFTAAQKRRMRALFALRNERLLTSAEQEELHRLVDALYEDMMADLDRKIKAAHPELKDVDIGSLSPAELKEWRERIKQKQAVVSKNQRTKR